MSETFEGRDMAASVFHRINLGRAIFDDVNLGEAAFDNVNLGGVVIRKANAGGMTIEDSYIKGLRVNGFAIDELIEAECDRRDPERVRLRMADLYDPDCVREVMDRLDEDRASFTRFLRALNEDTLTARPGPGEWSALECLRHLLFAEDLYLNRWLLRNNQPWHAEGLLPGFLAGQAGYADVGSQPAPDLDIALAAWEDLHRGTWRFLEGLTPAELRRATRDVDFGQGDVAHVLQGLAQHDLVHIRQAEAAVDILKKRTANAQRI